MHTQVGCIFVDSRYSGHKNSEFRMSCTFSNDDAVAVCGSEDGRLLFWDLVEVMDDMLITALHFTFR